MSIPPFMAEVITRSSAKKRPRDTTPKSVTRESAISAQEAITMSATLWRTSAVSELRSSLESASRKK